MSQLNKILFAIRKPISDDEQSDSECSNDSGDLSHIPIPDFNLDLEELSVNEMAQQQQANPPQPKCSMG